MWLLSCPLVVVLKYMIWRCMTFTHSNLIVFTLVGADLSSLIFLLCCDLEGHGLTVTLWGGTGLFMKFCLQSQKSRPISIIPASLFYDLSSDGAAVFFFFFNYRLWCEKKIGFMLVTIFHPSSGWLWWFPVITDIYFCNAFYCTSALHVLSTHHCLHHVTSLYAWFYPLTAFCLAR